MRLEFQKPSKIFWQRHPGLIWSNPDATDSMFIRAALVRPRFGRLLDIATEFGIQRLREEWEELQKDESSETRRAKSCVERILTNIQKGFAIAAIEDVQTKNQGL